MEVSRGNIQVVAFQLAERQFASRLPLQSVNSFEDFKPKIVVGSVKERTGYDSGFSCFPSFRVQTELIQLVE